MAIPDPRQAAANAWGVPASQILNADGNPMKAPHMPTPPTNPFGQVPPGSGGGEPLDLGSLKTQVNWIERGLIGLGVVFFGLVGIVWQGYNTLNDKVSDIAVAQEKSAGKLDTFDARVSGRLDLIAEKLDEKRPGPPQR